MTKSDILYGIVRRTNRRHAVQTQWISPFCEHAQLLGRLSI